MQASEFLVMDTGCVKGRHWWVVETEAAQRSLLHGKTIARVSAMYSSVPFTMVFSKLALEKLPS